MLDRIPMLASIKAHLNSKSDPLQIWEAILHKVMSLLEALVAKAAQDLLWVGFLLAELQLEVSDPPTQEVP